MKRRKFTTHIGLVFYRLTILSLDHEKFVDGIVYDRYFNCKCSCGKECVKSLRSMLKGSSKSCGCYRSECGRAKRTHGMKGTKEHTAWMAMRRRCLNPQPQDKKVYGGMKIDPRWDKFENFYSDMGGAPSPDHTLDRINVHKGYGPENCRWATTREQSFNKKNTLFVTIDGEKVPLKLACEKFGKDYYRIRIFIRKYGLTWKEAIAR